MNYTFENIAGYEAEKEELKRLCEIFNNREEYLAKGAKLPKGIVFYGGAGTGKTLFANVLASECGFETIKIDLGDLGDESEICRLIRKAFFKAAKRKHPVLIFFDEFDKVLPNYREEYVTDRAKTILTQLLTLIDGMDSSKNIIFVGTCNDYGALPETVIRPGRIDKKIAIVNPDYASRVEILKMYAQRSSCRFEIPMEEIAKLCNGLSCAALETLINECILRSDENGFISDKLIHQCLFEIKNENIPRVKSTLEDTIRACRNIGSFVIARSMNNGSYVLNLEGDTVCNDFFNGLIADYDSDYEGDDCDDDYEEADDLFEEVDEDEEDEQSDFYYSKGDFLNAITVRIGGYVAEEVILHKVYDNVKYDLTLIDNILFAMSENGMFGLGMRFSDIREDKIFYTDAWVDKFYEMFDKTIEECYIKAKEIIARNEELIRKLMPILVEKQTIDKKNCEPILEKLGGIKM